MIKNHRNKNEYYYAGNDVWIRNFAKKSVPALDINNLINEQDMAIMLENETANRSKMLQGIETEGFRHDKIAIVSDGYGFDKKQQLLKALPPDVAIIGVNETLGRWNTDRKMDYYVANNPYRECLQYLPSRLRVFPRIVVSSRTYPEFVDKFGVVYLYSPTVDCFYSGPRSEADYYIDDYRNPTCAAVGLAYRFGVRKLLLFCCDSVFAEQRPAADQLANKLWIYPQQRMAHNLVDGNLYWLKTVKTKLGFHSEGPEYKNATYIAEGDLTKFFAD